MRAPLPKVSAAAARVLSTRVARNARVAAPPVAETTGILDNVVHPLLEQLTRGGRPVGKIGFFRGLVNVPNVDEIFSGLGIAFPSSLLRTSVIDTHPDVGRIEGAVQTWVAAGDRTHLIDSAWRSALGLATAVA